MSFSFGNYIRACREKKGWTQSELAEKVGVDSRTIQRIERGQHKPQLGTRQSLAKAFGKTPDEFDEAFQQWTASSTTQAANTIPHSDERASTQTIQGNATASAVPTHNKGKIIRMVLISVPVAALLAVGIYTFIINPRLNPVTAKPVIITGTVLCADNMPLVAIWVNVLNGSTVNKSISGYADLRPLNSNAPKKTFAFDLRGSAYNLHIGCGGSKQQWKGVYKTETGTGPVYDRKSHYFICHDVSPGISYGPCDLKQ